MRTILCIHHAPCNDGAASAAALAYRLHTAGHPEGDVDIRFVPLAYTTDWNEPLPEHTVANLFRTEHPVGEIFIVDVSISGVKHGQIIEHLRSTDRLEHDPPRTICIDHHITALERIDELRAFCDETYIRIGPGLSGATLVWNYCNERFGEELPTPPLLAYVADQDIWEWKLPDSQAVNAALNVLDGQVDSMAAEFAESLAHPDQWLARRTMEGRAIMEMVASQVRREARHVVDLPLGTGHLLVANATAFNSELGNYLCEHHEGSPNVVALLYHIQENWSIRCSLRSIPGGTHNARGLAERYGGGGHDHAAGCRFASFEEFRAALGELGK